MSYKGIIFDFNGVLLWDVDWHGEVWMEYAKKLRGTPLSYDELHNKTMHRTNKAGLEYILGKELTDAEAKKLTDEKESVYRKLALTKGAEFALSPGAISLLDQIVERKIPHTIATASEVNNVNFFFKELHLDKWFDRNLVVLDDGTIPGKPHPAMYLKAAHNLHLHPHECIAIDDSLTGLQSAHNAGIGKIIGLGNADRFKELLEQAILARSIRDLTKFTLDEFNT